jgi:hypothetical protein
MLKNPLVVFLSEPLVRWVRSSVRLEHRTFNPGVAGSIPVGPAKLQRHLYCFLPILLFLFLVILYLAHALRFQAVFLAKDLSAWIALFGVGAVQSQR